MKTNILNWVSKFFRNVLLAGALLYIVTYLIIVFFRIQYPFELEWMEGGSVDHVRRILAGQQLYVSPSLEFIPFLYTPLYFYLSAAISSIIGVGFIPLRLVSFISSLGCFFIIFLIVHRETGNKFSGILATCLFAATFRLSGAWFDIARVDSLFLFFLLAALYLIKFATSDKSYILAGVFISLSFLTKQTALLISLPMMLYCIFLNRRSAFFFIGTVVLIIGGSTLILNYLHDGWYKYYIFDLPGQHPFVKSMFVKFWRYDIFSPLSIACIMSILYLLAQLSDSNKKNFLFYFLTGVGTLGASWVGRLHVGGAENVLLPAHAFLSILFGLAFHTFFEYIQAIPENKQKLLAILIYLVCILQFGSGQIRYNPFHQIPTRGDLEAGRRFINQMEQIKGEVFVPGHGYLPVLARKNSNAHIMAVRDILRGAEGRTKDKLVDEISRAIRDKRYSAVIIDSHTELLEWLPIDIEKYYMKQKSIFENKDVFKHVTGWKIRPEFIYIPKSNNTNY